MNLDKSAVGLAFLRGVESAHHHEVRFFEDKLAMSLLPGTMFKLFSAFIKLRFVRNKIIKTYEKSVNGLYGGMICRTRYFDEKAQQAINQGAKNVIIIGAGLDTRPYRLEGVEGCRVYELDQAVMSAYKQEKLQHLSSVAQAHVTYAAINFETEHLEQVLSALSFNRDHKTLVIWEGGSQHRTATQVDSMLAFVASCAAGSELLMTYMLEVAPNNSRPNTSWPFTSNSEKMMHLLQQHRLTVQEHVDAAAYRARYLAPSGRALATFDIENFVHATVD